MCHVIISVVGQEKPVVSQIPSLAIRVFAMGIGASKDKADRITRLTEPEKNRVQSVWRAFVKANRDDYGVILLTAMFTAHPQYLQLFEKFKHLEVEELRNDDKFKSLGFTVGTNLNNQIELLADPDNMLRVVKKNALFHARIPGVTPEHFESFGRVIIDELKARHGHMMNVPAISAWEKLFQSLNEHIRASFAAKDLGSTSVANYSGMPRRMQSVASTKSRLHLSAKGGAEPPSAAGSSRAATATSTPQAAKGTSPGGKNKRPVAPGKSPVKKGGAEDAAKSTVAANKSLVKKEPKSKGPSPQP